MTWPLANRCLSSLCLLICMCVCVCVYLTQYTTQRTDRSTIYLALAIALVGTTVAHTKVVLWLLFVCLFVVVVVRNSLKNFFFFLLLPKVNDFFCALGQQRPYTVAIVIVVSVSAQAGGNVICPTTNWPLANSFTFSSSLSQSDLFGLLGEIS